MGIASGLDNTTGDREAVMVRSTAKLAKIVRAGKYATTADDNGALGVWMDDAGDYRCEAMRHLRTLELKTFKTLKAVKEWWAAWLKRIGRR